MFSNERMMTLLILCVIAIVIVIIFVATKILNSRSSNNIKKVAETNFLKADKETKLIETLKEIEDLSQILKRNDVQLIYYAVNNLKNIDNITWLHKYVEFKEDRDREDRLIEEKEKFIKLQVDYKNIKLSKEYIEYLNKELEHLIGEKCFYEIISNDLENYNSLITFCIEYIEDKYNKNIAFAKPELMKLHEKIKKEKIIYELLLLNYREYEKYNSK